MSNVAYLKTDLSLLRLVTEDAEASWTAPALPDDEPESVRLIRQRADEAASWIASQPSVRRRLAMAVLDVDDGLCVWLKAPSDARPVLSASLRSLLQEWGDERAVDSVEPLIDAQAVSHAGRSSTLLDRFRRGGSDDQSGDEATAAHLDGAHRQGVSVSVVSLPDALSRLWLDALDRRSVRASRVMSLWHALALAWSDGSRESVCGVLMIEEGRLVWSWARGADLLAGGAVELDRARPASGDDDSGPALEDSRSGACKRLALDWLTWSSQLAVAPDRLVIVGPDCRVWADALSERWAPIDVACNEHPSAIRATLTALAAAPADGGSDSSRRDLQNLTHRPTRALRARYRLAGATMALLLLAASSVAFRLWQKAGGWRDQSVEVRNRSIQLVREAFPEFARIRIQDPDRTVQAKVQELLTKEPFDPPPAPRPILAEVVRICSILTDPDIEGEIQILEIQLDQDRGSELWYTVPDRQTGAEILSNLRSGDRKIQWEYRARTSPDPLRPRLNGDWILSK